MVVTFSHGAPRRHAFSTRTALQSKWRKREKEGTLMSYSGAVNYFFETYARDDVITDTDSDMIRSSRPRSKSPMEYTEALWNKTRRCNRVCDEYVLK